MSDQMNSSNEEGSIRRVTRSRACPDPPATASNELRKTRQSVDKEVLSNPAVTMSPRRPIRASRRLSTDDHEETTTPAKALRSRRISVDRESATGTPKLGEEGSESDSKPLLRRSRRLSVERDTATSTPKRMAPVLEAVSENAESEKVDEQEHDISPVSTTADASVSQTSEKLKSSPAPSSPSIRKRFEAMVGNFIDKIPLSRHSFSLNSDNDSDASSTVKKSSELNQTLDKNFKIASGKSPKKARVSDVHEEAEEEEVEDKNEESVKAAVQKETPKKSHLDRFQERAPKVRHSMPAKEEEDDEASMPSKRKSQNAALNKSLDKNFRDRESSSESSTRGSNEQPEEDNNFDISLSFEESDAEEEKKNTPSPAKKKSLASIFTQKTITTRHSIVTTTTTSNGGSPAKGSLNKSLSKDFKAKIEEKNDQLDEEEPMDIDLVASSDSDEEDDVKEEEEVPVKIKSLNEVVTPAKSPKIKANSPKGTPLAASPRKSLKAFREEEEEKDDGALSKDEMMRQVLERTIQEQIEKENADNPEESSSSDDEQEEERDEEATPATPKSPKKLAEEEEVKAVSPEKKVATPLKKSPKKAAVEVVPQDEDDDEDNEEDEEGPLGDEEDWEDDDSAEEEDSEGDSEEEGSVCKFEMEDVVEDVVDGGDDSSEDENDKEEAPEEEEEDVVINTKKLKTSEPPTKVSEILNKCEKFLITKKIEKKELRTVDEEKREKKKHQKEVKRTKKEAEMKRREELLARQQAQKELVEKNNQEAALKKKEPKEKKPKKDVAAAKEEAAPAVNKKGASKDKQKPVKADPKFEQEIIKKLGDLFASNIEKKNNKRKQKTGQENDPPQKKKKTLKVLQATGSASAMAASLQKPKKSALGGVEDEYVAKKKLELIPDKKYHQLAKEQKKEQNRLRDELKRQQGKPLKRVVQEPMRVLPKPVWTPAGEFEVESLNSPVKQKKKNKTVKRLAQTNGTDFQVEVLAEAGVGPNGKGNFKEQFLNRKDIRREDSHNLLKRRKFH